MIRAYLIAPEKDTLGDGSRTDPNNPKTVILKKKQLLQDIKTWLKSQKVTKYPAENKLESILYNNKKLKNEIRYWSQIWTVQIGPSPSSSDESDYVYNALATSLVYPDEIEVQEKEKIYGPVILIRLADGIKDSDEKYGSGKFDMKDLHSFGFGPKDWRRIYYALWKNHTLVQLNCGSVNYDEYKNLIKKYGNRQPQDDPQEVYTFNQRESTSKDDNGYKDDKGHRVTGVDIQQQSGNDMLFGVEDPNDQDYDVRRDQGNEYDSSCDSSEAFGSRNEKPIVRLNFFLLFFFFFNVLILLLYLSTHPDFFSK